MTNDRADFGEVFANPEIDPIPVGFRSGKLVHGLRISAEGETVEEQLPLAFENMRRSIENTGGGIDNIAQVSLFLDDARQAMPAVNTVWVEMFPDEADRPTYKFISTPLPGGRLVQLEYFAVLGERRRVINIDGVAHTNPIPIGVRIGDYLFSSRVLPMDAKTGEYLPDAGVQADHLFTNVGSVLAEAGMDWPDLTQGRLFLADMDNLPTIEARWAELFPDGSARPRLHPIHYQVGPLLVMLEVLAVKRN